MSTNSGSSHFTQLASRPGTSGGNVRPIACAPVTGSTEAVVGPGGLRDSAPALPPRPPTKRSKVTLVACQPCQQRKHKCDGARPICSQCVARKRSDCAYDAAGDQRRTSALKQRIHNLERHARDLQDIVASIGSATDKEAATAVARQLADEGFRRTAEVAQALRRDETPKDSDAGDYAMLEASPSSAGSVVDPNLPYWPIDATEEGLQLGQNEYDSTPMEAFEQLWPSAVPVESAHRSQGGSSRQAGAGNPA